MKILMFSSDPKMREEGSAVSLRIKKYAEVLEKLSVVMLDRSPGRYFRFWKGYREAKNLLRKDTYDLIVSQEIEHAFLAWLLSRKFGVPFQAQIHTDFFDPHYSRELPLNKFRAILAGFIIPRASCVRVVSTRIKNSITPHFPGLNISVLPIYSEKKGNPGELNLHSKYPGHDFYILMASRLTREKNFPLALLAFGEFLKSYPRTLLVIAGEGPEKADIARRVMELGIDQNVQFEGWQEGLGGYYSSADVYLLASDYEGYGMSVVEALQSGCPVVMTDVGVAGEIVKNNENGIIVPVGDAVILQEALLKLRRDEGLRKKLGENAKKTPMPYTSFEEYRDRLLKTWQTCGQK